MEFINQEQQDQDLEKKIRNLKKKTVKTEVKESEEKTREDTKTRR